MCRKEPWWVKHSLHSSRWEPPKPCVVVTGSHLPGVPGIVVASFLSVLGTVSMLLRWYRLTPWFQVDLSRNWVDRPDDRPCQPCHSLRSFAVQLSLSAFSPGEKAASGAAEGHRRTGFRPHRLVRRTIFPRGGPVSLQRRVGSGEPLE